MGAATVLDIAVIGAGISGLGLGMRLRQAGRHDFVILEQADDIGGTWRDNSYPGCACDIPAHAYSYSFELKDDWTQKWVSQAEILAYLRHCVRKHGLEEHLRLATRVRSASWNALAGHWDIDTDQGPLAASHLVTAVGQLAQPKLPAIPGLDRFRGRHWHSARWDHGVALAGRDIAVIGNAASAAQIVPELARVARRVRVFQRSANWIYPRGNRAWTRTERWLFARVPGLLRAYRAWLWLTLEARRPAFRTGSLAGRLMGWLCRRHLERSVTDPALRAALTPGYPAGAKRILVSDDYYAALQRGNVGLVTAPITEVTERGIVTDGGATHPADHIVFATGFRSTDFLAGIDITGRDGVTLATRWRSGAVAYLGMMVPGFPNFFTLYGPNSNLGHHSIIFIVECQIGFLLRMLAASGERGLRVVEPTPAALAAWDDECQRRLSQLVWSQVGRSWYMNEDQRIINNWPGSVTEYWWRTRSARLSQFSGAG